MNGLHKFSFYNYIKSVLYAPVVRVPMFASILLIYVVVGLNFFIGFTGTNGWAVFTEFACCFVLLAGIIMGNYFQRTPDLASIMPISQRRSLVYRFLSVLCMMVYMMVMVAVVILCITAVVMLFMLIPNCNDVSGDSVDAVEEITLKTGAYGGIFGVAYFIIMYSVGMIFGFIKRRRNRNIYAVCVCVCLVLANILMNLPYKYNPDFSGGDGLFFTSPLLSECYEAMKLPQLCISLWCVTAACMLGAAIYLGIRENKLRSKY